MGSYSEFYMKGTLGLPMRGLILLSFFRGGGALLPQFMVSYRTGSLRIGVSNTATLHTNQTFFAVFLSRTRNATVQSENLSPTPEPLNPLNNASGSKTRI